MKNVKLFTVALMVSALTTAGFAGSCCSKKGGCGSKDGKAKTEKKKEETKKAEQDK